MNIANAYMFKDYTRAVLYFHKILNEKTNSRNELPKQSARNGLGLAYRNEFNDLDRSDSYFLANLEPRKIKGIESQGMILMAKEPNGNMRFLRPDEPLANGAVVN